MGAGAAIAADQGLPFVIGDLRDQDRMLGAIDTYRNGFRPSRWSERPYVVVSGIVAVAATTDAARRLLITGSRIDGVLPHTRRLPAPGPGRPDQARSMTAEELKHYEDALRGHIHGTEDDVAEQLATIVTASGADEVLVTTSTYDRAELYDSYRRLARTLGLSEPRLPEGNRLASTH
ncbi:LLM class flavin-dependent oxidoreductase [Micromonospora sp. NPDC093244]|uniref:LLM class flavin-dependent oxidoreductase n=1 Tax=Micromonospora sp. NPDC093244 TaxID=3155071 RepID=UPI0034156515